MRLRPPEALKTIGPGFVVAATGVGAGDLIAAAVSGAQYGTVILWSAVFGAVIKFVLNEGIARWQLATGTTVLEAWIDKFKSAIVLYFGLYLILWSFIVAGALISACGLAAHAMVPQLSVSAWGAIHSLIALALVYFGRYALLERLMKIFVAMMFVVVMLSAALVRPDLGDVARTLLIPNVPQGSGKFILGVIGGVGGSVTLLSYGYWIREKGWWGEEYRPRVQLDLASAYCLTGLFGVAIMIVAAGVNPKLITGSGMVLEVAEQMAQVVGPTGKWIFLVGFWGAVFTSTLGVWQGVPYLFTDFVITLKRRRRPDASETVDTDSVYYKTYLLYLALPPMVLLLFERPVWMVVIYAIAGALFMPFLAGTLLYMNNRYPWVKNFKNGWLVNTLLVIGLALFAYVSLSEIRDLLF